MAIERLPPHDIEAERALLGSLLIDPDGMGEVADRVSQTDFYRHSHGLIFHALEELHGEGTVGDYVTICERLERQAALENAGGEVYVSTLANDVPSSFHAPYYADIVTRLASHRMLIEAAGDLASVAHQGAMDPDVIAERFMRRLSRADFGAEDYWPIRQLVVEYSEEFHQRPEVGIPTGIKQLDAKLGGFNPTDLIVVGARTSVGKTWFMLERALHAAKQGVPTAFFSIEQSSAQVVERILAHESNVETRYFRDPQIDQLQMNQVGKAVGDVSEIPLYISAPRYSRLEHILSTARAMHRKHGVQFICVDYLQIIVGDKTERRYQEIGEITRSLRGLARELEIPVLTAAQLGRVAVGEPPQLHHLRESGDIEQDSDQILLMHQELQTGNNQPTGRIFCKVAKNRSGPAGDVVTLNFKPAFGRFEELDKW